LFPEEVRRELGKAIFDLQKGGELNMPVSRPVPSVYIGVSELRIRDRSGIYRVFYYRQSSRGILVFHAFMKETQTTPKRELELARKRELELARKRLKELLDEKI
jgi:phage-related protein